MTSAKPDAGYRCRSCGVCYALDDGAWRCGCGGVFDLVHEADAGAFSRLELASQPWSMWRYRAALPFTGRSTVWQAVTLGEGATPLVGAEPGVLVKLDFVMPTLSFKDRGSVVLVSKAAEIGVRRLVADSSGNAGVSIAAYAARAGIEAEVFLPAGTSESKVAQLRRFGAAVRRVEGSRAAAAAAAVDRVESSGSFYASHVFNPLFHHGTKTFAFELWEQLGGRLPQTVVLPAGNGTLLIGASLGFEELVAAGAAERVPRLIAVQAERCAPLAAPRQPSGRSAEGSAEGGGDGTATPGPPHGPTIAEGIAIAEPPRLEQMREVVEASGGEVRTVSEEAIATARDELARLGIDVEPTAAVAYAARHDSSDPAGSTVVALTGAGLKSPGSPRS